jgi:integrase
LRASALFEAYIEDRRPAAGTVERWKVMFRTLDESQAFPSMLQGSDGAAAAQEWLDGLKGPGRAASTVRHWLAALKRVFSWAKRKRLVEVNPFQDCVVEVPRRIETREEGRALTDKEVQTILRAALQVPTGTKTPDWDACRRWVPFLCAYTGCRVGEATQLRACDVELREGPFGLYRVMKVTPAAGTVKGRKARTVPIHEHLVEQGFPEFVQAALAARGPEGPLFHLPSKPDRKGRKPPAGKARERLAGWIREIGVTDPDVSPNHGMRHHFKRRAARAGIEKRIRDAMCGHAPQNVGDQYEVPSVEDMAVAMRKFPRYPL